VTIEEMIIEAISDVMNEQIIKSEGDYFRQGVDGDFKVKKQIPFEHSNATMLEHFKDEFNCGQLSNTSLKWFAKVLQIEHIFKSDRKFGDFWNLILSTPTSVTLKLPELKKIEKFRKINPHNEITKFKFNGLSYIYIGDKTAEPLQGAEDVF
jgi:hypothetical protein